MNRQCKICGIDISEKNKQAKVCSLKCHRENYFSLQEKKDMRNKRQRERYKEDDLYRLKYNFRIRLNDIFKIKDFNKTKSSTEILGCSYKYLKSYLESKFEPWMTWENKGLYNGEFNYGWDIDHIIPLSTANTIEEIISLNHFTNLQPLCSKINRDIKKDKQ